MPATWGDFPVMRKSFSATLGCHVEQDERDTPDRQAQMANALSPSTEKRVWLSPNTGPAAAAAKFSCIPLQQPCNPMSCLAVKQLFQAGLTAGACSAEPATWPRSCCCKQALCHAKIDRWHATRVWGVDMMYSAHDGVQHADVHVPIRMNQGCTCAC